MFHTKEMLGILLCFESGSSFLFFFFLICEKERVVGFEDS